jgi:hypothetical protein
MANSVSSLSDFADDKDLPENDEIRSNPRWDLSSPSLNFFCSAAQVEEKSEKDTNTTYWCQCQCLHSAFIFNLLKRL